MAKKKTKRKGDERLENLRQLGGHRARDTNKERRYRGREGKKKK